ncbi:MAG: hypothetical protein ACYTG0_01800 [Planctomycetota bacterium]|jgi:tetratricopeptide (TPR) repeat protein
MRSEDRHRMQRNELADWLNHFIEQVKPYGRLIAGVVAVVVIGAAVTVWWTRQSAAQAAFAWQGVHQAWFRGNADRLSQITEQYAGTDAAEWAAVLAGDVYLQEGCQELFRSKEVAVRQLTNAAEHYLAVQKSDRASALVERATFGLGRAYEALAGTQASEGGLQRAIEEYQKIVDQWPDGAYGSMAARRLEDLQQEETKELYDKFVEFDPKPLVPLPGSDLEGLLDGTVPDVTGSATDEDSGLGPLVPEETSPTSSDVDDPDAEQSTTAPPTDPSNPQPTPSSPPDTEAMPDGAQPESETAPAKKPASETPDSPTPAPEEEASPPPSP